MDEQTVRMIVIVLDLAKKGQHLDGMKAAQAYYHTYGKGIDWHEFSNMLDRLQREGFLEYANAGTWRDGMVAYRHTF